MANPHRGHVPLQAGDREYRISYGINSLCELEEAFGKSIQKIIDEDISDGKDIRMSSVRKIVWAGLIDQDSDMTLKDAGDIADLAGIPACMAAIGKAFALAFPEAKGGRNPRKPRE
ncbi:GTA-gp10 family protein [Agrobacterium tumefaciens]|uniref:GTA-gp10 family protein n=1 Tax=Agrobacterium tumefaciens TaxID=358 RepID=UPI0015730574|nr:GTA-gp10 family protein [Agrobacterium tumefaciens]NSX92651.1 gene transfer agent family protein [Agrobacterium tumefaciens]NSX92712.1 gene transfer agent family protein [Agrobacterium tumefaciens]